MEREGVDLDSTFIPQESHNFKRKIKSRNRKHGTGLFCTKKAKGSCSEDEFNKCMKSKGVSGNVFVEVQSIIRLSDDNSHCQACIKIFFNLKSSRGHCESEGHKKSLAK